LRKYFFHGSQVVDPATSVLAANDGRTLRFAAHLRYH
jgi:hypothetical protein